MTVRLLLIYCIIGSASWVAAGCGGGPEPEAPKQVVGPTTDPAGEAFSKPSKPSKPANPPARK
jgi:hypothetical protein